MRRTLLRATGPLALVLALFACSEAPLGPSLDAEGARYAAGIAVPQVVISQVYGGGGNSGATLRNDFIELFNPGTAPVSLAGWSVQYASSTGSTWQVTALSGTIQPGGYYLVQEAAGTGGTTSLPTPDATGTIPMGGTAGKVALSQTVAALSGTCPAGVVDLVSFGTASTNCNGAGTTGTLSNTTAAIRNAQGCAYTGSLSADFAVAAPSPRNGASPTIVCPTVEQPQPASVTVAPVSDTVTVGATQAFTAKAFDAAGQEIAGVAFTWTSSNPGVATVSAGGVATSLTAGSTTITATTANGKSGSATLLVQAGPGGGSATNVRVSEFHYDNDGTDAGEAVELEGDANGSLAGWKLVLYSGSTGSATQGQSYGTIDLSGTFGSTCGARGVLVFNTPGLQNGDKDGFALVNADGQVIEFLSYEGSFAAVNGPAAGMTSTDVGVDEDPAPAAGRSLQRAGNGVWFGPNASTFGACNPATPPLPQTGITFTGRHPTTDPALPVGFQDQLFATLRDAATGATIPTVFAWTSETPTIASVDQDGVITALSAGTAIIRATATDGTTSTYSLPMGVATAGAGTQYGHNTEFGEPADADASDDILLRYTQFTSSFNPNRGTPNWVSYNIDATHFGGEDRCDCFTFDPELPSSLTRYTTAAYTGAGTFHGYGIDRGHLARSFDRTAGSLDNAHTYYFSNIIPQAADNNQGPWASMENYLGDQARLQNKEVYVIAGVAGSRGTLKNEGRITIPAQVWKVAVIMPRDRGLGDVDSYDDVQVIAAILPNEAGIRNVDWRTYQTTVDAVEALSGYDLLARLPDAVERIVESNDRPPVAAVDGPYTGTEGTAVHMSAGGSTDPDGDVLTYAWDFGDGTTGTGASPTHAYADNGNYVVKVTVTDPYGAESTATTSVLVVNVAPTVAAFAGETILRGESYASTGTFADAGTADTWTATVDYGDGSGIKPLALSGNGFTLGHTYTAAGTFTVTVRVTDDDGDTGIRTATVVVQSAAQGAQGILNTVAGLVANGTLTSSEGNALSATLNAAKTSIERDRPSADNQLRAFINQVQALQGSGRLSAAVAQQLIAAANRVIASIG